jgi:predicted Ser/Thr protein kinase
MRKYRRALEKEGKLEEAASVNFMPQTFHLPS